VLEASRGLVVLDEAYTPFAQESFLDELARFPRLLVMRTVSKVGLAGLRLGWLAADPAWTSEIEKLRLPYNINSLTQLSAEFALAHAGRLERQTALIRSDRERLQEALGDTPGVCAWPSRANFVLFRVPAGQAGAVFDGLKAGGVLVKRLDGSHPLLADCLRVTVGARHENDRFIAVLRQVLGAGGEAPGR
jgi:histidinol-phosphate aminotransferase